MVNAALVEICTRLARHASFAEPRPLQSAITELRRVASETVDRSAPSFADVSATLRYHHIAPLLVSAIQEANVQSGIDPTLLAAIERACVRQPTEAALLETFDEMQQALRTAGIDAVLLKGIQFARRLYRGYERRPQYDLDVLVRANDRAGARRVLSGLGYTRETYDLHSETFVRAAKGEDPDLSDMSKADIHGWLRRAPAYRLDERAIWRDVRPVRLGTVDVLTLSDEYNLVLLGLSCFEDLGQGMAKVKQLLDTLLFLRDVDRATDWEAFFRRRAGDNTETIIAHVFSLVVLLFDARETTPRLAAALVGRSDRRVIATRALAVELISAPRKHAASFAWFARVYPGNVWLYLAWFWATGFPGNAKDLQSGRVWRALGAAAKR